MKWLSIMLLTTSALGQVLTTGPVHQDGTINIAGVVGNVSVINSNLPDKAIRSLQRELNLRRVDLVEAKREADAYRMKYDSLRDRLSELGMTSEEYRRAGAYLKEGNLSKAETLLTATIAAGEDQIDKLAQAHSALASIKDLSFDSPGAIKEYRTAYSYRPDNQRYAYELGKALYMHDETVEGQHVLESLFASDHMATPEMSFTDVSLAMKVLGQTYADNLRYTDAETQFGRLLAKLKAAPDRNAYMNFLLALVMGDLGDTFYAEHKHLEATQAYIAGLQIAKSIGGDYGDRSTAILADRLGKLYLLSGDLNSAGTPLQLALSATAKRAARGERGALVDEVRIYRHLGWLAEYQRNPDAANEALKKSLDLLRHLDDLSPSQYQPSFANGLMVSLTHFYKTNQLSAAEDVSGELISMGREMESKDFIKGGPILVDALNEMSYVYKSQKKADIAESALKESLELMKRLARIDPDRYESGVASVLESQGELYFDLGQTKEAENRFVEATEIYKALSESRRDTCEACFASALQGLGMVYVKASRSSEAKVCLEHALAIRRQLASEEPFEYVSSLVQTVRSLKRLYEEVGDLDGASRMEAELKTACPFGPPEACLWAKN